MLKRVDHVSFPDPQPWMDDVLESAAHATELLRPPHLVLGLSTLVF